MNHKSFIEFLKGNGFLTADLGKKINDILASLFNLKPAYAPVRVKQHPANLRNNKGR